MRVITYRKRLLTPDAFPALGAWYDAGVNVTLNTGVVETWTPRAGKSLPIGQTNGSYRPAYDDGTGANAINGFPTLRTGSLKWLLTTAQDIVKNKPGQSLFAVFRLKSFDGLEGAVFSVNRGVIGHELISGTRYFTYRWRKSSSDAFTSLQGPIGTADTVYVMWCVSNYESGSESTTLLINGIEYSGTAPPSGNSQNTDTPMYITYSTGSSSTFNRVSCDLAECGVFERALNGYEVGSITNYFKAKYGLSF